MERFNQRSRRTVFAMILIVALLAAQVCALAYIAEEHSPTIAYVPLHTAQTHALTDGAPFIRAVDNVPAGIKQAYFGRMPEVDIYAQSAIVIDYDTGDAIYEKDADTLRAPASMTKVMTAYIIFEELESGNLTLDTKITISNKNANISKDSRYPAMVYLRANSQISVDMLLKLILLPSASASCIAMAEHISGTEDGFVVRMNETAQRLGIDAEYKNVHGAFPHYISARGQALLIRDFIQRFPAILDYTSLKSVSFNGKTYYNTNKMVMPSYQYEGCDGFKTGTTVDAGFCFSATAVQNDKRIISVVMRSIGDHYRFTDTEKILTASFQWLHENPPTTPFN